jgi:hypothetical protein
VQQLSQKAAEEALRTGKVALLVEPGSGGTVVYRYDDTNPEGRTARMLANRAIQDAAGRKDPVSSSDRVMREPGSRYIDFLIPGLLGMNLMGSAIWGMGFAIVDARRKKLIKRLIATPMPRSFYLISFILSRLLLLVIEVGVLLGFGVLVFHVPVRGSLLDFAMVCVLGSLTFAALGLLIASRAQTIEAASGLMNLVMLPMWIVFRSLLFRAAIPGCAAAGHQGAAINRRNRRATGEHAARGQRGTDRATTNHAGRMASGLLYLGVKAISLEVTGYLRLDLVIRPALLSQH